MDKLEITLRQLAREKKARKEAELIAENKSLELYYYNKQLRESMEIITQNISELNKNEKLQNLRHEITRIIAERLPFDDTASKILKNFCETLQLSEGEFWKFDEENGVLKCIYTWAVDDLDIKKFADDAENRTFAPGVGLPGIAYQNKEVFWFESLQDNSQFIRRDLAKEMNLSSAFALPLLSEDKVFGVMAFFSRPRYQLDESFIQFLSDTGRQVGFWIERDQVQKRFEMLLHQAGIANVASSIVHNMGNIINSFKITLSLLRENISRDFMKFSKLASMIKEQKEHLSSASENRKEQLVLQFNGLEESFSHLHQNTIDEIQHLMQHIKYMENFISVHRSMGGISSVATKVFLPDVVNTAIKVFYKLMDNTEIEVIKEFKDTPTLFTDQSKVMQILVNLIQNARDAILSNTHPMTSKKITIRMEKDKAHPNVNIVVQDNGTGISADNLKKLFSMGFTTKLNSYGIGLHASILAAQEIGGILQASSEGLGRGATFTLSIPLNPPLGKFLVVNKDH